MPRLTRGGGKPKIKLIYKETYGAHAITLQGDKLPVLNHTTDGQQPVKAEITEAGTLEWDGEKYEYHTLKLYFKND